jgi:hypothetical protein
MFIRAGSEAITAVLAGGDGTPGLIGTGGVQPCFRATHHDDFRHGGFDAGVFRIAGMLL